MASHAETISILRKILYITIFLFIIFGLTSIGISVDAARKNRPVSLATSLVLLSVLLAFLVTFAVIIITWRHANQRKRWREERDIESRWLAGPNGERYLPTSQELRELRRKEKKEKRQRDRQRSIWDNIRAANERIISPPRDPLNLTTNQPLHRASQQFIARPDPIFGHGTHGIFGARPMLGGGLNPNHGLSPPTSPRSPNRVLFPPHRNAGVPRVPKVPKPTVCGFC